LKKIYIYLIFLNFISCALPQFSFKSGGSNSKEIDAKSVQVDYFENKSAIGGGFLGASFTESLRDIMQSQTKLNVVDKKGDVQITGFIKNYNVSPVNIQAGSESAAQNRLSMAVNVNTYFQMQDSIGLTNSTFKAFIDYDANTDFNSIEEELVDNLNYQLTQDIFDKIFGGEW
jgi:hypothetical protein